MNSSFRYLLNPINSYHCHLSTFMSFHNDTAFKLLYKEIYEIMTPYTNVSMTFSVLYMVPCSYLSISRLYSTNGNSRHFPVRVCITRLLTVFGWPMYHCMTAINQFRYFINNIILKQSRQQLMGEHIILKNQLRPSTYASVAL